jgi:hypothetical protein
MERVEVAVLVLLLVGCAKTISTPTPAPLQVANSVNALAQSLDAATSGLIAARDAGKLSQADLNVSFSVITTLASAGKQINAELRSTEGWEVQKGKVLKIITSSSLAAISAKIPPTARVIMQAALALFNVISTAVGGPTI